MWEIAINLPPETVFFWKHNYIYFLRLNANSSAMSPVCFSKIWNMGTLSVTTGTANAAVSDTTMMLYKTSTVRGGV